MAAVADLSLEFGHLYITDLADERAKQALRREAEWLTPMLHHHEAVLKRSVTTVVMVDDYFSPDGVDAKEDVILSACEAAGLRVDWLVREAECAATVPSLLDQYLVAPTPIDQAIGTTQRPRATLDRWLMNDDPPRPRSVHQEPTRSAWRDPGHRAPRSRAHERPAPRRRTGPHSIHLDVELWSDNNGARLWACPLLAAWWQLIRLGLARDTDGKRIDQAIGRSLGGVSRPLAGASTLTVLHGDFLGVETAVQTILRRAVVPEEWSTHLRRGPTAGASVHLDRIGYLFPPAAG